MALFPTIQETQTGRDLSAGTSHVITMPSTIDVDDMVLVLFCSDNAPTISVGSSTGSWSNSTTFTHTSNNFSGVLYWCYVTVDNTASLTLSTNTSQETCHITYRLTSVNKFYSNGLNEQIPSVASGQGTSTNADPPNYASMSPPGIQDYLWVVVAFMNDVVATGAPTNCSGLTTIQTVTSTACSISSAYRQYRASSYNPSTFTSNSDDWYTLTVAVLPPLGILPTMYRKSVSLA